MSDFLYTVQTFIFKISAYLEDNFVKPYFGKIQTLVLAVCAVLMLLFLIIAIVNGAGKKKFKKKYKQANDLNAQVTASNNNLSRLLQADEDEIEKNREEYSDVCDKLETTKAALEEALKAKEIAFESNAELTAKVEEFQDAAEKYNALVDAKKKKKAKADKEKRIAKAKAEKAEIAAKLKELEEIKAEQAKAKQAQQAQKALEELKVKVVTPVVQEPEVVEAIDYNSMKMPEIYKLMKERGIPTALGMKKADAIVELIKYDKANKQ